MRNPDDDGFLFTSESVTEGHPDKMADQLSDAILDAALAQDPGSRVAVETLVTTGMAVLAARSPPRRAWTSATSFGAPSARSATTAATWATTPTRWR